MLLVTQKQREQTGEPAFVARLVFHFQRYHLETIYLLPEELLQKRLEHCLVRGRKWGLTWEYSLTVFAAHMMTIHPEFDEQPEIRAALGNASLGEPDERIDELPANVPDEAWDAAEARGNPEIYWHSVGLGLNKRAEVEQ
jgi:hypothetical protein